MHFHRDLLIIADGYAQRGAGRDADDVFVGSPPLAFTFGLGGLAIFPLRFGAAAALLEHASPANMIEMIERHRATVCFTAPTAYRAMLAAMDAGADLSSLRVAVSAGETLPAPVYDDWIAQDRQADPRWHRLDGDAAHLHHQPRRRPSRRASTGRPVPGYEARIVDEAMNEVPRGRDRPPGRARPDRLPLSRRRAPARLRAATAGTSPATRFVQDADGRFHFVARSDDMIVSAGYNIAGPEVEAALSAHPSVRECAVVGAPDRGPRPDRRGPCRARGGRGGRRRRRPRKLQDHVKATIAPYKYPRSRPLRRRRCRRPRPARSSASAARRVRIAEVRGPPLRVGETSRTVPASAAPPSRPSWRDPPMHESLLPAGWSPPIGYANGVAADGRTDLPRRTDRLERAAACSRPTTSSARSSRP